MGKHMTEEHAAAWRARAQEYRVPTDSEVDRLDRESLIRIGAPLPTAASDRVLPWPEPAYMLRWR